MSQLIISQGTYLGFADRPEKHQVGRADDFLLPVKFRKIPIGGFRWEVEYVSTNQRPGGHFAYPIDPKNKNFVEGIESLRPVKCRKIVQNISVNQRLAGNLVLFSIFRKTLQADINILLLVKFQRRSRKCKKVSDGRRSTRYHNSALEPSAQVY